MIFFFNNSYRNMDEFLVKTKVSLDIPENQTIIKLPYDFGEKINENTFNENIKVIYFNNSYNKNINYLPLNLEELHLGMNFNSKINCLKNLLNLKVLKFTNYYNKTIDFNNLPQNLELLILKFNCTIINNNNRKLKNIKITDINENILKNLFAENLFAENLYLYIRNFKDLDENNCKNFNNIFLYSSFKENLININNSDKFEKEEIIELDKFKIDNYIDYSYGKVFIMKIIPKKELSEKEKLINDIELKLIELKKLI